MRQVGGGGYLLRGVPPRLAAINLYVLGDVLVDAGLPWSARRIFRQIEGVEISAHALTHAHPDHMGASAKVKQRLGVPVWCGAQDVQAAEAGRPPRGPHQSRLSERIPDV